MPLNAWNKFDETRQELIQNVNQAKDEGRKIVYLDEICFTKRLFQGRSWSSKNSNLHVDQKQIYQGYRAVIAACSSEVGIELIHTYSHAITSMEFVKFLK